MIPAILPPTESTVIWRPWRFDRIEVFGWRYIEPARGPWLGADDDRAREPVALSIPGEWFCEFESGPNLLELAGHVARILGPGLYGLKSARRLGFRDEVTV